MTGRGRSAGVVSRGVAFVIDVVCAAVGTLGCAVGIGLLRAVFAGGFEGSGGLLPAAALAALPVVFVLYCAAGWSLTGRTLGKALFGLRVVDRAGGRPSFSRSVVRALGYLISSILWLGFLWAAVDSRHEAFHDKLARTRVVYD